MIPTAGTANTLRMGAVCAIAAAVGLVLVNVLHPPPPDDPEQMLRLVTVHSQWPAIHLLGIVCVVLMVGAFMGLGEALEGNGRALRSLALAALLLGATTMVVAFSLDGAGYKTLADNWGQASAADRSAVLQTTTAVLTAERALFGTWAGLLLGLTFFLYGLAIVQEGWPKWLSLWAMLGGLAAFSYGSAIFLLVPIRPTLFKLIAALNTLWLLAMGLVMWKRARESSGAKRVAV